ncbi:hypothetical protein L1987_47248 [Smallanthus sonchifolius]|uniref:Uncharacterized protein n=1 Tax=Smallanthus sonchifolius TaxID=185202 RepID=A0ACB9G2N2_9ASTR|nr:hypothetical protein L1987_47248 [Smallanthus sonchifolius]
MEFWPMGMPDRIFVNLYVPDCSFILNGLPYLTHLLTVCSYKLYSPTKFQTLCYQSFLEEMLGRTFFVILFFWAALTVITPILIRLSASANLLDSNGEIKSGGIQSSKGVGLLSRRALGSNGRPKKEIPASSSPSPSPSPSSRLRRRTAFEPENRNDVGDNDGIFKAHDFCFKGNQPLLNNNQSYLVCLGTLLYEGISI